jgi:hypothetical protein
MTEIKVVGGQLSAGEIDEYIDRAHKKYPDKHISGIDFKVDGDFIDITYHWSSLPFERIRRITGYLVGTLDRFNDAKRAEERDRIKHVG